MGSECDQLVNPFEVSVGRCSWDYNWTESFASIFHTLTASSIHKSIIFVDLLFRRILHPCYNVVCVHRKVPSVRKRSLHHVVKYFGICAVFCYNLRHRSITDQEGDRFGFRCHNGQEGWVVVSAYMPNFEYSGNAAPSLLFLSLPIGRIGRIPQLHKWSWSAA